jgi:hypothetical protein
MRHQRLRIYSAAEFIDQLLIHEDKYGVYHVNKHYNLNFISYINNIDDGDDNFDVLQLYEYDLDYGHNHKLQHKLHEYPIQRKHIGEHHSNDNDQLQLVYEYRHAERRLCKLSGQLCDKWQRASALRSIPAQLPRQPNPEYNRWPHLPNHLQRLVLQLGSISNLLGRYKPVGLPSGPSRRRPTTRNPLRLLLLLHLSRPIQR